jgi:hypothetical protein
MAGLLFGVSPCDFSIRWFTSLLQRITAQTGIILPGAAIRPAKNGGISGRGNTNGAQTAPKLATSLPLNRIE